MAKVKTVFQSFSKKGLVHEQVNSYGDTHNIHLQYRAQHNDYPL